MTTEEIRALWFEGARRLIAQYARLCALREAGQLGANFAIGVILEAEIGRYRN